MVVQFADSAFSGTAIVNQPIPSPGAYAKGVGRGRCVRVLSSLMIQPRKNIISFSTMYFSFMILFELNKPIGAAPWGQFFGGRGDWAF